MTTPDPESPVAINPYAPPTSEEREPERGPRGVFAGKPRDWSIGDVFAAAYRRVRAHSWQLGFVTLATLGIPQLALLAPRIFLDVDANGVAKSGGLAAFAVMMGAQLASWGLTGYLTAGATKIWLDVARGKDPSTSDLFAGFSRAPAMLATIVLQALATALGFVCLIVPGFVLIGSLGFAQYFVVDAKMGPIRSLRASWQIADGSRLRLIGFWMVGVLVLGLGALACGLGVLVAYPIAYVAQAMVYLRLSGRWRKKMSG